MNSPFPFSLYAAVPVDAAIQVKRRIIGDAPARRVVKFDDKFVNVGDALRYCVDRGADYHKMLTMPDYGIGDNWRVVRRMDGSYRIVSTKTEQMFRLSSAVQLYAFILKRWW